MPIYYRVLNRVVGKRRTPEGLDLLHEKALGGVARNVHCTSIHVARLATFEIGSTPVQATSLKAPLKGPQQLLDTVGGQKGHQTVLAVVEGTFEFALLSEDVH